MRILQRTELSFKQRLNRVKIGKNFLLIALVLFLTALKPCYSQDSSTTRILVNNQLYVFFFPINQVGTRYVVNESQIDLLTRIAFQKGLYEKRLFKQAALVDTLLKENTSLNKQLSLAEKELEGTDKTEALQTSVIVLKDKNIDDYKKIIKNKKTWNTVLICGIPVSFGIGVALTAYIYSTTHGK